MDKKAQMELRFGKGPEHEELCDLFAEFAFQLDRRIMDGFVKDALLNKLDEASVLAHTALQKAYPEITEIKPQSNVLKDLGLQDSFKIKEHGENVTSKKEDLYDTDIPDTKVSLTEENSVKNYDSGGFRLKGIEFKPPWQKYPPVID